MKTLIERIDALLGSGCDLPTRIDLFGEKACYLARSGEFDQANSVIKEMRRNWGIGSSARAMAWIMLTEGLILYFDRLSDNALDRMKRANLIAKMAALHRLYTLTLAWMAQVEFFGCNYESMGVLIRRSMAAKGANSLDVRLRTAITLADANLYVGHFEKSQALYELAHSIAVETMDRVAIGAMIYNRSILGVYRVLSESIVNDREIETQLLRRYELELNSAEAFDGLTGLATFSDQIQVARFRVNLARGDYGAAHPMLVNLERSLSSMADHQTFACSIGDRALCAAASGDTARVRELLSEFSSLESRRVDVDENLHEVFFSLRAASIARMDEFRAPLEMRLLDAKAAFHAEMDRVRSGLVTASIDESRHPDSA